MEHLKNFTESDTQNDLVALIKPFLVKLSRKYRWRLSHWNILDFLRAAVPPVEPRSFLASSFTVCVAMICNVLDARRPNSPFFGRGLSWATMLPRSLLCITYTFRAEHWDVWRFLHLFSGIFFKDSGDTIRKNPETEKQKLQWQDNRLSQAGYTPSIHPKIGTSNCPTLPLHWIVVTSHLTPRQIKQKMMGIHLFELCVFSYQLDLFAVNSHQFPIKWVSFIGELFFCLGQISASFTHERTHFTKISDDCFMLQLMSAISTNSTRHLRSATLHCNRSLQSTVGYTYLNLNSQVQKLGAVKQDWKMPSRTSI